MRQQSNSTPVTSEKLVREIRRATRKQYSAEEKIRIVLDGLSGETAIAELCRRQGIAESRYYSWSKEFLEAGKRRLAGDTARAATTDEVKQLRTAGGVDGMNLEQGRAILDEMRPGPRSRNSSIATKGRWETC